MSCVAKIEEGLKPNYYALVISIIKGYTVEKSLRCMGISGYPINRLKPMERRKSYKDICIPSAVIKISTGISYRSIGRIFNVNYITVQRAIMYYKEKNYETIRNQRGN